MKSNDIVAKYTTFFLTHGLSWRPASMKRIKPVSKLITYRNGAVGCQIFVLFLKILQYPLDVKIVLKRNFVNRHSTPSSSNIQSTEHSSYIWLKQYGEGTLVKMCKRDSWPNSCLPVELKAAFDTVAPWLWPRCTRGEGHRLVVALVRGLKAGLVTRAAVAWWWLCHDGLDSTAPKKGEQCFCWSNALFSFLFMG